MQKHDWFSERILVAVLVFVGYFGVGGFAVGLSAFKVIPDITVGLTRDMFITVGPLLGIIIQGVFKTDKTERQVAQTAATLADKSPDLSGKTGNIGVLTDSTPVAETVEPPQDSSGNMPQFKGTKS
jgi:hypothetical protein